MVVEDGDRVVTFTGGTYARGQVQLAADTQAEAPGERNGAVGQERLAFRIEARSGRVEAGRSLMSQLEVFDPMPARPPRATSEGMMTVIFRLWRA